MGNTLINLYTGQPGIANTLLYTALANTRIKILDAVATNDTTVAKYISIHRVPAGDTAGDANIIVNQKSVASRETVPLWQLVGQVLEPADFLSAIAEAATQITLHISGIAVK